MITIINYGIGNLNSIKNMFARIGVDALITSNKNDIGKSTKIILPGIGNFDHCIKSLRGAEFFNTLEKKVLNDKTPVLGICIGFQMLFNRSEEGKESGLGWIDDEITRMKLPENSNLKIPHIGWSDVNVINNDILFNTLIEPRFYFVHSYCLANCDNNYATSTANYGYDFAASVRKENIFGVQFHPEKSHKFGMQLLKNFAEYEQN
jgi:glutamine amidotransferase